MSAVLKPQKSLIHRAPFSIIERIRSKRHATLWSAPW